MDQYSFSNLNSFFSQAPTPQQREMMEEAAARIAQDNCELACCFIQKTAVEKAGPEMDKRLATVSGHPPPNTSTAVTNVSDTLIVAALCRGKTSYISVSILLIGCLIYYSAGI